jgi:hypothetical protein
MFGLILVENEEQSRKHFLIYFEFVDTGCLKDVHVDIIIFLDKKLTLILQNILQNFCLKEHIDCFKRVGCGNSYQHVQSTGNENKIYHLNQHLNVSLAVSILCVVSQ